REVTCHGPYRRQLRGRGGHPELQPFPAPPVLGETSRFDHASSAPHVPSALGPRVAAVHPVVPPTGRLGRPGPWCSKLPPNPGRLPGTAPIRNVAHPIVLPAASVRLPGPE